MKIEVTDLYFSEIQQLILSECLAKGRLSVEGDRVYWVLDPTDSFIRIDRGQD